MLQRSTWRRVWRTIRGFPILVALLAAAAALTGSQALWLLFYAIAAAGLLGYGWSLLVTARLEPTIRVLDDYAEAGAPPRVEVSARSAWHVPRWGVRVALPGVALPGVVSKDARLLRRGRNDFGRPGATATDPFGLVRLTKGLGEPYQITGYPAMVPVAPDRIGVLGAASLRIGEGGSASARSTGTATSAGVREYVSGDSLSHVHWLSTAKRAELMTREFERGGGREEVVLLLDLAASVQAGIGALSTMEHTLAIAASLTRAILEAGLPVGLVAHDGADRRLDPVRGRRQERQIMDLLAHASADGRTPLLQLAKAHSDLFGATATAVIIAPAWGEALEGVAAQCERLGAAALLVALDGPRFQQWEAAGVWGDGYSAEAFAAQRREVARIVEGAFQDVTSTFLDIGD